MERKFHFNEVDPHLGGDGADLQLLTFQLRLSSRYSLE